MRRAAQPETWWLAIAANGELILGQGKTPRLFLSATDALEIRELFQKQLDELVQQGAKNAAEQVALIGTVGLETSQ